MTALEDVPQSAYRAIVVGILFYFGFLVVGSIADQPALVLAAQVIFGLIAIGIGALLFARSSTVSPLVRGAAAALVLGGVAQFFWLATGDTRFDLLASALVFLGVGGYLVAIWTAD